MLGLLQEVEFNYNEYRQYYEGELKAEGCRRGVCLRYRISVYSRNGHDWEPMRRRKSDSDLGGCLRQVAVDALMELSSKYEVGVWYEYRPLCTTFTYLCSSLPYMTMENCGVMINGIKLGRPYCRTVEECVEKILRDYRSEVERLKEPPMRAQEDVTMKFLSEHPELQIFGEQWVKAWLPYAREKMIKLAEILRNHPKAKKAIEQFGIKENPLVIEVYISKDGTEECVTFGGTEVFCVSDRIKKTSLEYIGQVQPRGLMAYVPRKEFVRVL